MEQENFVREKEAGVELPTTSKDPVCRAWLRFIEKTGKMDGISNCITEALNTQPDVYKSAEEFLEANPNYEEKLYESLSYRETEAIRQYSGARFAWINSVARGIWDYNKLGRKTPELEEEMKNTVREIVAGMEKAPAAERDFMTFRGTNLDGFRQYGIEKLSDLKNMKGQFMMEQGFTSTAIVEEQSFDKRGTQTLWVGKSNVEMRYHIPAGADNFVALTWEGITYSPASTEVVFNRNALSYISNVEFDKEGHAVVDAILIPRELYDD